LSLKVRGALGQASFGEISLGAVRGRKGQQLRIEETLTTGVFWTWSKFI
jgi:hypothetical protein